MASCVQSLVVAVMKQVFPVLHSARKSSTVTLLVVNYIVTLWTSIFYTKKFGRNNARAECYLGNIHDIYTSTKFINHPVFSSKL